MTDDIKESIIRQLKDINRQKKNKKIHTTPEKGAQIWLFRTNCRVGIKVRWLNYLIQQTQNYESYKYISSKFPHVNLSNWPYIFKENKPIHDGYSFLILVVINIVGSRTIKHVNVICVLK